MQDYLKVVVTGEVDSGKSTLIGRFLYEVGSLPEGALREIRSVSHRLGSNFELAYLLDSFEEERKGQLTIDTTQVFCRNKKGRDLIFIDVPGHRELIKNMLSGSSYADIAILVIDIKKSIEEGTRRHINILKFLGIKQIIFVLNKADLVSFNEEIFNKIQKEITEFSKKIGIQPQYVIPISAIQGDNISKKSLNISWYKGLSLAEVLNTLNKESKKEVSNSFYFPIQDIYSIDSQKICVGSIISGEIKRGEGIKTTPFNQESQVKEIKVFGGTQTLAQAPESIGLVLTEPNNFQRGQIIYRGESPEISAGVLAKIFCVYPINLNERLLFKCTTQESYAKIERINRVFDNSGLELNQVTSNLKEMDAAEALIVLEKPVAVKKFQQFNILGRFVLQDKRGICAVGIIL